MLVLTRRVGQSIKIGDRVVVTVCESRSGAVKIGIDAPDDVPIHRAEGSPSSIRAGQFCRRCRRWVGDSEWSTQWACCDPCATESPSIHDDERYDGVDIHESEEPEYEGGN